LVAQPWVTAETPEEPIGFLDWKHGSWAVPSSHPAGHTPVWPTEPVRVLASSTHPSDARPG